MMKIENLTTPLPGDFCLICGSPPATIGIFVPEDPEVFGGIKGKTRLIRYCLCLTCQERPTTPEVVEKICKAELGGGTHV